MPKITFTDKTQVPEGLEAAEVDGKWVVDVVNKSKLDEFRDNNTNLAKERDTLKAYQTALSALVGDDVEAFKTTFAELNATSQSVKDGKLKGTDAIEAEVANRTKALREDFERQLLAKSGDAKTALDNATAWEAKYKKSIIATALTKAIVAPESGVEASAIPDILSRATSVFSVDQNEKLIPKDGEAIIYGSDGATPMTPEEWVAGLKKTAPHFFKRSAGGGSEGGAKSLNGLSSDEVAKLSSRQKMELARRKV